MKKEILVKFVEQIYSEQELEAVGFDKSYRHYAVKKNTFKTIKILNLTPQEASILKQSALALGFDAAVNRGVINCSVESSDALLSGSLVQFEKLAQSVFRQPFRMKKVASELTKLFSGVLPPLNLRNNTFDWSKPYLMGILNITPDSFSDGGKFLGIESAVEQFEKLVNDGADIIDIGAESTRPGHEILPFDVEIARLKPILKELKYLGFSVPISVDTRNVETAEMALNLGVEIINDVGFNGFNKKMIDFVNLNNVPYVVTHNQRINNNLMDSIYVDLADVLEKITSPVIADIGIGFGKNADQNFELINRVSEFKSLGVPLLVGHSRKSFLSKTFNLSHGELDGATATVSTKLILGGVNILRVHDVKRNKLVINVLSKLEA